MILPLIFKQFSIQMSKSDSAFTQGFLLYHVLPNFVGGFVLFGFTRFLLHKCGLDDSVDANREFESREDYLSRRGILAATMACQTDQDQYDEFGDSIEMASK